MAEILTEQIEALKQQRKHQQQQQQQHRLNPRRTDEQPDQNENENPDTATATQKKLPKGVVLDKQGKPCRPCTSFASWATMTKQKTALSNIDSSKNTAASLNVANFSSSSSLAPPPDCPADVEQLGRSSWTLLHSVAATYPEKATPTQQSEMRQFLLYFSRFYPCWTCGEGFQAWMSKKQHEPRVEGRDALAQWMCEAHNVVNRQLGKPEFDCSNVDQRWRTGWKDGRCN